jgi:hypothetical protein
MKTRVLSKDDDYENKRVKFHCHNCLNEERLGISLNLFTLSPISDTSMEEKDEINP